MENQQQIIKKFEEIGARIKFEPMADRESRSIPVNFDVRRDKKGEFFRIGIAEDRSFDLSVIDVRKDEKHLLLLLKVQNADNTRHEDSHKVLCGYDERHWFTCGVPNDSVRHVFDAIEALKPGAIVAAQKKINLKEGAKRKRKNAAFVRQGEWFFRPVNINPPEGAIHRNEPISRGGGSSPHMVEMIYREGGTTVFVHRGWAPNGLTRVELRDFLIKNPNVPRSSFHQRTRNARVFAEGKVRHRDHKTIILPGWHEVLMNREAESRISRNIVFLD